MERLNSVLRWCYRFVLFVLPIYAVFYVVYHDTTLGITAGNIDFLQRSYFLVVLFSLFFIVLYSMYLPTNLRDTASLLLGPMLGCLTQLVLARERAWLYLAELGMVYVMEISVAFFIVLLVILGLGIWSALKDRELDTGVNTVGLIVAQLLFAIPCGGAIYIFGRVIFTVILPETLHGGSIWSLAGLVAYGCWLVPFIQNMWVFLKVLYQESIAG